MAFIRCASSGGSSSWEILEESSTYTVTASSTGAVTKTVTWTFNNTYYEDVRKATNGLYILETADRFGNTTSDTYTTAWFTSVTLVGSVSNGVTGLKITIKTAGDGYGYKGRFYLAKRT